jgi:hypothetical protein
MNLDTITMPREEAAEQLAEYQQALERHQDAEYEAVARGLRWLRRDDVLGLLDIRAAITAGGVDYAHRPRLAVCQADAKWCWMERWDSGSVRFANRATRALAHNAKRGIVDLPAGTLPIADLNWNERRAKAMVPMVPARLRPKLHLRNYHVLWEAEWTPEPPVDPALLKHIGGDLYAVLGIWDLTPLERAILAGRNG